MGIIRKRVWIRGRRGHRRVQALFDTGSSRSFVREDVAREVAPLEELVEPRRFEAARGTFLVRWGIFADIELRRQWIPVDPVVVPRLTEEFIIGADFLQLFSIKLDPKRHRLIIDPKALVLKA